MKKQKPMTLEMARQTTAGPAGASSPPEISSSCTPVPLEKIVVDPEFAGLIQPLSEDEKNQLEENLLKAKRCRDPLVLWKGRFILLDGHNRRELCLKHNLPYQTSEIELADRAAAIDWIILNQLGRRNLTTEQASNLRGTLYNNLKRSHGERARRSGTGDQPERLKTDEALASKFKVSPATIRRDGNYADAVDTIATNCGEDAKKTLLSGKASLTREEVVNVADLPPEQQVQAVEDAVNNCLQQRQKKTAKKTIKRVGQIRLPREPKALVQALVKELGRKVVAKVHQELGKVLGTPETASNKT